MKTIESRFWEKVDKTDSCWLWTASTRGPGYGQCTVAPRTQGYAHRFSYELANGPIPHGFEIDHICLTRLCVRPDHLRLATRKQNAEHHAGAYVTSQSGIRGVSWHKARSKWIAQVRHHGQTIYLGSFSDPGEAAAKVKAVRLSLFTHNDADRSAA